MAEAVKVAVRPKARERFDNDNGGVPENEAELFRAIAKKKK